MSGSWQLGDAYILGQEDEVAQVVGSSKQQGSWKQHWLRYSGRKWPATCQMLGCGDKATDGAHVYVKHLRQTWILPCCHSCNMDPENRWGRGASSWYSTKANALVVWVKRGASTVEKVRGGGDRRRK